MTPTRDPRPRVKPDLAQAEPQPATRERGGPADLVLDSVVSEPLRAVIRAQPTGPIGVIVELRTPGGPGRARRGLAALVTEVTGGRERVPTGGDSPYVTLALTAEEIAELARRDAQSDSPRSRAVSVAANPAPRRHIQRMWPNFEIAGLTLRSVVATKCRAAQRTFDATGEGIVWAVLDSGIDAGHRHFAAHANLDLPRRPGAPLVRARGDRSAHGRPQRARHPRGRHHRRWPGRGRRRPRPSAGTSTPRAGSSARHCRCRGSAAWPRRAKLLSCTVLRPDRTGDLTALLDALLYIQQLNDGGRHLRVHGVNISVGHMFDPRWYAAGLTPVCREVDRLVASGVVVVVAAGNTGYGYAKDPEGRTMRLGLRDDDQRPGQRPACDHRRGHLVVARTAPGCPSSPPRARPGTAG